LQAFLHPRDADLPLAIQKVEGSNPFSRFRKALICGAASPAVPNELVVEVDEFETDDPALQGERKMMISLSDADGGTELVGVSSSRR
jgi:hypothetical protein